MGKRGEYVGLTGNVRSANSKSTWSALECTVIDEIDDQLIIINVTKVVQMRLNPTRYASRNLSTAVSTRSGKTSDHPTKQSQKKRPLLYLRVLIGNDRFFRDSNIFLMQL